MASLICPQAYSVHVTSAYGDNFYVASESLYVKDVKHRIEERMAGLKVNRLKNDDQYLVNDDDLINSDNSVQIEYLLSGGGFEVDTKIPDCINLHILLYKCGLQDMPNLYVNWWCEGMCCCCFNKCGLLEFTTCQILCLGPCPLTSPSFKLTTSLPDALVVNALFWKCGIQNFPDCMKEDCATHKCFCIHSEFGLKDWLSKLQICCLKLTC